MTKDMPTGEDAVTTYTYNDSGLRVKEVVLTEPVGGSATTVTKEYLFDPQNPTGYAQVLEEYLDGVLSVAYTLGHDVIAQASTSGGSPDNVYYFLHDGHGSTRALAQIVNNVVEVIEQYAYDAYGVHLTTQNLTQLKTAATALTRLLYSGVWTQASGVQYLRARFYDPTTGRFNRVDPFAGNTSDPQSLHKYLYTHGNPVLGIDPSGEFAIPFGVAVAAGIITLLVGSSLLLNGGASLLSQHYSNSDNWLANGSVLVFSFCLENACKSGVFSKSETLKTWRI
ncbi:MAG: hypothetical protein GC164_09895, partial [Phycisphaera sp.]|nr:hypothetical protein [Phycisphaera sp.]